MKIFIYGGLSHANEKLKQMYDKWAKNDSIRPLILLEFVLILRNTWAAIDFVRSLNEEVLKSLEQT
jgi:hypothetical protein